MWEVRNGVLASKRVVLCASCPCAVCDVPVWCFSLCASCSCELHVSLCVVFLWCVQPVSKRGVSNFGRLGATIVDAMDTLHIMGLTAEFNKARE